MTERTSSQRRTAISPTRQDDYPTWYQEVVKAAELATMSHVRGSMVIKAWGYGIWEQIRNKLDQQIRDSGHDNVYFPVLIPLSYFEREAEHVAGFAKEMAVVTHHRLEMQDGSLVPAGKLSEPLVIRPTSETIIGESMSEWISSYRDLPLLLNQWANVVRWELRPRIFLRTTEFLWQEGHTAHATADEALKETLDMHEMYRDFAENWTALAVIAGEKSPSERFPGAVQSFSIEAMMQDGKALQAGTSHYLGQNFAKASDITFVTTDGTHEHVHTTSWGMSTRMIGALIMTHADDDGMVVPPRVAPQQVVIVPMLRGADSDAEVSAYASRIADSIKAQAVLDGAPVRVRIDKRQFASAEKKWQWIKRGVPLLVEVGARDLAADNVSYRLRLDFNSLRQVSFANLATTVSDELAGLQQQLLQRAQARLMDGIVRHIDSARELTKFFENGGQGFVLAKWCGSPECEVAFKPLGVTLRCLPFELRADSERCIVCGAEASADALFGQSY